MRMPRAMAPLRHRPFRFLAAGQLASNLGDAFYAVALPWYVLASHGGVLLLGTVLAAYGIPRLALLAIGGHLSDRWRPWTVMMVADTVRALAAGVLAAVALAGPASATLLVPVAAILGAGEGLFLPGSYSIVPTLLPDDALQAGNALTSGGTQLALLVGPAVGGATVALVGSGPAFVIDACSFVVSALTLAGVRSQQGARALADADAGADAGAAVARDDRAIEPGAGIVAPIPVPSTQAPPALAPTAQAPTPPIPSGRAPTLRRVLLSERPLQVILLVAVAANLGSGGLSEVALPALAHGPFHTGAGGYGALIAAFGAGALVGTLLAGQARRSSRPAQLASAAFLLDGGFVAIVPYLGGVPPAAAALAVFGLLNGFGNVVMVTAFQRWAPPALLGRLMGLLMTSSFGIFPVSVLAGGAIVHSWGPAIFFPLAGAALALAVLVGLSQPSWRQFGATTDRALHVAGA